MWLHCVVAEFAKKHSELLTASSGHRLASVPRFPFTLDKCLLGGWRFTKTETESQLPFQTARKNSPGKTAIYESGRRNSFRASGRSTVGRKQCGERTNQM